MVEGKGQVGPVYGNLKFLELISQAENLDEANWKKGIAGLGLGALMGLGGGAGIGTMIPGHDGVSQTPQTQQDVGGLSNMPSFGQSGKAGDEMPLDKDWSRSPTRGDYVWVSPDQIDGSFDLPLSSMTADDYRTHLADWDIDTLYKLLYGNSGQWSYTKKSPNTPKTFDNHPDLGNEMLPPDWSIAFDVYKGKVEGATQHIQDRVSSSEDGGASIAQSLGHQDVESLLGELQRLNNSVQY